MYFCCFKGLRSSSNPLTLGQGGQESWILVSALHNSQRALDATTLEPLSPRPQHERGRPHSRTDSGHTSHQPLPHMTFRYTKSWKLWPLGGWGPGGTWQRPRHWEVWSQPQVVSAEMKLTNHPQGSATCHGDRKEA